MEMELIIDDAIKEFETYIKNDLGNEKHGTDLNVEIVLQLFKFYLSSSKTIPIDLLRGFQDISVYSIRNYFDVPLGEKISKIGEFIKGKYPFHKELNVLGIEFDGKIGILAKELKEGIV